MFNTEVTQKLYKSVMGQSPVYGANNEAVVMVTWCDAVYFCNRLSEKLGFTPVYAVDGKTDVRKWNYVPHKYDGRDISRNIKIDYSANGFRLPTVDEWKSAAKGGLDSKHSESNTSKKQTGAKKKANGYGLYNMTDDIYEWCSDFFGYYGHYYCGESDSKDDSSNNHSVNADYKNFKIGFRIVRKAN